MSGSGGGLVDRLIGVCVGLLVAAFALYCAVKLIESILPVLIVMVGAIAVAGLIVGGIVVIRTWRDRW